MQLSSKCVINSVIQHLSGVEGPIDAINCGISLHSKKGIWIGIPSSYFEARVVKPAEKVPMTTRSTAFRANSCFRKLTKNSWLKGEFFGLLNILATPRIDTRHRGILAGP